IVDRLREGVAEAADVFQQASRQILMDAARTEIGRVQARPRDPLIEFHDALALLKAPEKRRHGAYVDRKGRDVQQVIGDPRQLGEEHADVLGASRSFDAQKLLSRQGKSMLLAHWADIVKPVEIGQRLKI